MRKEGEQRPEGGDAPRSTGALTPPPHPGFEEERRSLLERLRRIADHSPRRPRYAIMGTIARGGMGEVLRVWDNDLQRELAMKRVASPEAPDEHGEKARRELLLASFIEEARITSRLDHPGIVPVHEIAVDKDGGVYFTMPLVRGRDFARVIELSHQEREGWNLTRSLGVLLKVCETVAFAHTKHIIHRDLKPSNVMVGPFGETYVMDWGLALMTGHQPRGVGGTPAYMAPEQALGEVGPLSDVYSLGAMLYELLSGSMPASGTERRSSGSWSTSPFGVPPPPLRRVAPDLPAELAAICEKAMARKPERRYRTAMELAEDLRAYLEGRVVRAYESGRLARARKWLMRNKALAYAMETVVLVGVIAAGALVYQEWQRRKDLEAEQAKTRAEKYAADLRATDLSLRVLDLAEADLWLNSAPRELRGWEWGHLLLRSDTSERKTKLKAGIHGVAVRPGGLEAAVTLDDERILVLDLSSEEVRLDVSTEADLGPALCFDPSGEVLAFGRADGSIGLLSSADGSGLRDLEHEASLQADAIAFSPEGRFLAAVRPDGTVDLWDTGTYEFHGILEPRVQVVGNNACLAFGPGGRVLAVAYGDGTVRTWDVLAGEPLAADEERRPSAHAIAFRGDGLELAVGSRDGSIRVYEAATLDEIRVLERHEGAVRGLAYSPDGGFLASCSDDKSLREWDTGTGRERHRYLGHQGAVNAVAVLADGRLLSGSSDASLRRWDSSLSAVTTLRGHEAEVNSVAFAGQRVISASLDGTIRVWGDGRVDIRSLADELFSIAVPADGSRAAIPWGAEIRVLELEGEGDRRLVGHTGEVNALAFRPDGERLISYAPEPEEAARVWDTASGRCLLRVELPEGGWFVPLAFHPDGASFATGSSDGRVRLWGTEDGDLQQELEVRRNVWSLAFDNEGRFLACGHDDRALTVFAADGHGRWFRVGPPPSGQTVEAATTERFFAGHENQVHALSFSPDGKRLASGSIDGTVRIWDPLSGALLLTLYGHDGNVRSVAFDEEGRSLASASSDGTVRIWRSTRPEDEPPTER